MILMTERDEEILADLHLTLLRIACPEFEFTVVLHPASRYHWLAMRKSDSHIIIAPGPAELLAMLGTPNLPPDPMACAEAASFMHPPYEPIPSQLNLNRPLHANLQLRNEAKHAGHLIAAVQREALRLITNRRADLPGAGSCQSIGRI